MKTSINLYSTQEGEIQNFLNSFYNKPISLNNNLKHQILFDNPVEMVDIISAIIDNKEKYNLNLWISLDKNIYINVTPYNYENLINLAYNIDNKHKIRYNL